MDSSLALVLFNIILVLQILLCIVVMLSFSLLYSIPLFEYTKISSFLSNVDGWVFSHFKLFLINHINILVPVLQRT